MNISLNIAVLLNPVEEKPCIEAAMPIIGQFDLEFCSQVGNRLKCVTLCHFFPHPRTQSPSTLNTIPENVIYLSSFFRKLCKQTVILAPSSILPRHADYMDFS